MCRKLAFALGLCVAIGCGQPKTVAKSEEVEPAAGNLPAATTKEAAPVTPVPTQPGVAPNKTGAMTPNAATPKDGPLIIPPLGPGQKPIVLRDPPKLPKSIPAGADGWRLMPNSQMADVGAKIDIALKGLSQVACATNLYVSDAVRTGSIKGATRIKDAKHYSIDFQTPSEPTKRMTLAASGADKTLFHLGKYNPQPQAPTSMDALVSEWPDKFPEYMFAPITQGKDVFKEVLSGWAAGKGGYRATLDEKTITHQDGATKFTRTYYRVIATREGQSPVRVEMRIDGSRMMPVTIRIDAKDKNGKDAKAQWSADWKFGQQYKDEEFHARPVQ